ncbi:adenylate/guanylate cyclase domain-containing protein [Spirulina subsalsa]|uniref:adenylate/guanylate cyclase domain-containing protein n=1 Tax=Spirulina subsalsa TaxID=54311 RepID=UPI0002E2A612|nr:adenylate/guanylate cyclase domain-containing protein [Spirulina subsalsa]
MKFWSKSLRTRLVAYFLLLSLPTVTGIGALTFWGARVVITRLVFDRLRVTAFLKADALALWLGNQQEATFSIAQLPEIRESLEGLLTQPEDSGEFQEAYRVTQRALRSAVASRPELAEVFILSRTGGKVMVSTQTLHEGQYRVKDTYFIEGLNGAYVQDVYPSPMTGRPTITIATPLRNGTQEVLGVLAVHLDLKQMDRIVSDRVGLGESGKTYLVDQYNSFVSGNRFGMDDFPRGIHSQGINRAIEGDLGGELYLDYRGIPVIGYYMWLENLNLALLVEIDQVEAFTPARNLAWGIVALGLISMGLLTGGVYWLAQKITRPILAIKEAAIQVAEGDFNQLAPVMTEDEVGVLARSFNRMTEELRELYAGLQEKVRQLETAELSVRKSLKELEIEQAKSERLLLNTLPQAIARRLKIGESVIAEHYDQVTVLFADLVSFTRLSEEVAPKELVERLNMIFSAFDQLSEKHGLEKIKTIGDAYMVVGGLPKPKSDHAEAIARMALDMQASITEYNRRTGESLSLRIGIHSGSVVAGVIGIRKFSYDLWGDTVNVASRMESQGLPGAIQVTALTYELLKEDFHLEKRGIVDVKGKGEMMTYLLIAPICTVEQCQVQAMNGSHQELSPLWSEFTSSD